MDKGIKVFDNHEIVALLTDRRGEEAGVIGVIALDLKGLNQESLGFVVFNAVNVVLGTGGPAGIYKLLPIRRASSVRAGLLMRLEPWSCACPR
jgi:succinate dehydrogenase/fumarate reductase flavoprotein subunit